MHSRVVAFTSQASGASTPVGLLEPQVGVLHGILGVGHAAEHPIGQAPGASAARPRPHSL